MKLSKSELEAVIAASSRTFVPYNKLVLSAARQARPEDAPGAMPLPELAASIYVAGLLHNLVVVRGKKGVHEVCAGGRRLRAMALLVADGRWPENQPVAVLVVAPEQALIASLIENVQREAMHPADEFTAFARLVAEGRSVEDVAAAFGVTPLVVARRLKLAAVSPSLLGEYRAERIGLDCLCCWRRLTATNARRKSGRSCPSGRAAPTSCAGCCVAARSNPTATASRAS